MEKQKTRLADLPSVSDHSEHDIIPDLGSDQEAYRVLGTEPDP